MRTITTQEIAQIDQRLESLKIQYLEIHHEIRDHYFTELEKKSAEEFEATFQQLNETFASSVVKKMENNLERSTNKLINQLQWKELKFWKFTSKSQLYPLILMLVLCLVYSYLDVKGMYWMVLLSSLAGILISWYVVRKEISFSVKLFRIKSMLAFPRQILRRSSVFAAYLTWINLAVFDWNNTSSQGIDTIMIWLLVSPILLYMLTLVQVALTWKIKFKIALI